jgi:diguanylate cyclase (GGDEF)-like protein
LNVSQRLLGFTGTVALLLGLAVLVGWILRAGVLVQVDPLLPPMAFNTALAFVAIGVGLIGRARRRLVLSHACAAGAVLLGLVVIVQHASGRNIGVDHLFLRAFALGVPASFTAEMSPITAACLMLSGVAILVLPARSAEGWRLPVAGLLSIAVIGLCTVPFLGYLIHAPTLYGSGRFRPIAVLTVIGLVVIGLGVFLSVWRESREASGCNPRWIAAIVPLGIAVATWALWQALVAQEQAQTGLTVDALVVGVGDTVQAQITTDTRALTRIAARWERDGRPPRASWEADAVRVVQDSAALQAIEWIDPSPQMRWVAPLKGNEAALHMDLRFEPRRRAAFDAVMKMRRVVVWRPIDLVQGGRGFLIYVPVVRNGHSEGLIAGVVSLRKLLSLLTGVRDQGYGLRISQGGEVICRVGSAVSARDAALAREVQVDLGSVVWSFRLTPTDRALVAFRSALPPLILAFGLLSALLVGGLLVCWQAAREAHRHWEGEAARRAASEALLAEAQVVARLGSAEVDLVTGQLTCSHELLRLFEFDPADGAPSLEEFTGRYHPDDRHVRDELLQKALEDGEPYEFDIRVVMKDGSFRWFQVKNRLSRDASGKVIRLIGAFRDITPERELQAALMQANTRLQALATVDSLTGLYNRRALQAFLTQEFERWARSRSTSSVSIVFLDIDLFKDYNDAFGHPAGDQALAQVGRILQQNARAADVVARYGGEEFIVLMPDTGADGAIVGAERMRAAIESAPWPHRSVTASFGVATTTLSTKTQSALVSEADAALYVAKRSGRNTVVHYVSSSAATAAWTARREDMEHA